MTKADASLGGRIVLLALAGLLPVVGGCGRAPGEPAAVDLAWDDGTEAPAVGASDGANEPAPAPDASHAPEASDPAPRPAPASQRIAYDEVRPKSVLELQPWRQVVSTTFTTAAGREGVASLVDLNPAIGAWLLLRIEWLGGGDPDVYHLENPFPQRQAVRLDPGSGTGLILARGTERTVCDLWSTAPSGPLAAARSGGQPFAPLCGHWLFLRNRTEGHRTSKEWAADFLRDKVWGGEKLTTIVRDTVFRNTHRKVGRLVGEAPPVESGPPAAPLVPRLGAEGAAARIVPTGLGLRVEREPGGALVAGRWYPVLDAPGVFVGALRPDLVSREVVERQGQRVNALDPREASALVYVVAFDLERHELRFAVGTEHPRVGWSERVLDTVRDPSRPGPDGIGTVAPLVRTGMVGPFEAVRVAATFTGGFKRSHGAFRSSALATANDGTHYGFVEQGVILSKLQPGLSTLAVYRDGRVTLGTWSADANARLGEIRYARQNGVPILERDPATGEARPGTQVKNWGAGNWSGSVDKELRTLRAGACVQEAPHGRFLLYGYFTGATPSAMARVFEAYRCTDAMLLDMNALEHTYLAVYPERDGERGVEHLIDEMRVLDKGVDGKTIPRFVGFADNRDFFFLLARQER